MPEITFPEKFTQLLNYILYIIDDANGDQAITNKNLFTSIIQKIEKLHKLMGEELSSPNCTLTNPQKIKLMKEQMDKVNNLIKFIQNGNEILQKNDKEKLVQSLKGIMDERNKFTINNYLKNASINKIAALPIASLLEDLHDLIDSQVTSLQAGLKLKIYAEETANHEALPNIDKAIYDVYNQPYFRDYHRGIKNYIDSNFLNISDYLYIHIDIHSNEPSFEKISTSDFRESIIYDYEMAFSCYSLNYSATIGNFLLINDLINENPELYKKMLSYQNGQSACVEEFYIPRSSGVHVTSKDVMYSQKFNKLTAKRALSQALFYRLNGFDQMPAITDNTAISPDLVISITLPSEKKNKADKKNNSEQEGVNGGGNNGPQNSLHFDIQGGFTNIDHKSNSSIYQKHETDYMKRLKKHNENLVKKLKSKSLPNKAFQIQSEFPIVNVNKSFVNKPSLMLKNSSIKSIAETSDNTSSQCKSSTDYSALSAYFTESSWCRRLYFFF